MTFLLNGQYICMRFQFVMVVLNALKRNKEHSAIQASSCLFLSDKKDSFESCSLVFLVNLPERPLAMLNLTMTANG